jgi:type II secretory pathway pseudopilin PulG
MARDERGFIIIEAMVTLLIMGVALFVLGMLVNSTQRNEVRTSQRNQSSMDLVEAEVRRVRSTASWNNVTLTSIPTSLRGSACDTLPKSTQTQVDTREWCSHQSSFDSAFDANVPVNAANGLAPVATGSIGDSDYDIYRYIHCVSVDVAANGDPVAATSSAACPLKRVRIVVETREQGLARRLPPDGLAYREFVMSSTLFGTPVS